MAADTHLVLYWLVLSLAAARVAVLLAHDTILAPLRERIFLRWPPQDNLMAGYAYQTMDRQGRTLPAGARRDWHMTTELLTCTRCLTVWTAGALYALGEAASRDVAMAISAPLALMATSAWIARRM